MVFGVLPRPWPTPSRAFSGRLSSPATAAYGRLFGDEFSSSSSPIASNVVVLPRKFSAHAAEDVLGSSLLALMRAPPRACSPPRRKCAACFGIARTAHRPTEVAAEERLASKKERSTFVGARVALCSKTLMSRGRLALQRRLLVDPLLYKLFTNSSSSKSAYTFSWQNFETKRTLLLDFFLEDFSLVKVINVINPTLIREKSLSIVQHGCVERQHLS
jgi:hypothetical protein